MPCTALFWPIAILQCDRTVKGIRILCVLGEISGTNELKSIARLGISKRCLGLAADQVFGRILVEIIAVILSLRHFIEILEGKQTLIQSNTGYLLHIWQTASVWFL